MLFCPTCASPVSQTPSPDGSKDFSPLPQTEALVLVDRIRQMVVNINKSLNSESITALQRLEQIQSEVVRFERDLPPPSPEEQLAVDKKKRHPGKLKDKEALSYAL